MKPNTKSLWKTSFAEAEAIGSGRRTLQSVLIALLPLGIIAGAFYLCYVFYDQSQQEELRRDYLSTITFRLIPKQIAADLDSAHVAILQGEPFDAQLRRTGKIAAQLDELLTILNKGGIPSVFAASSHQVRISPVESPEAREALKQAFDLYNPMRALLQTLLAQDKPDPKQVIAAAELFDARSSRFLSLGDIVRLHAMEEAADAVREQQLYFAFTVLGALGLLVALGVGVYQNQEARRRRLLTSSNQYLADAATEIALAKQETDLILAAVRQGMLLMFADSTIGDQHSAALTEIFETEHLAGFKFLNILQRLLSEKLFLTTRDYFSMLFDLTKKEKLLNKINPLARVEASFPHPDGGFFIKHLEFTFRRILDSQKASVARVLVTVRDITHQVELEESLKQAEQKKERQFELLLGILHIGPDSLQEFMTMVESELHQINETLKAEDFGGAPGGPRQTALLRERLDLVFRSVHNIKGNAEFLKLDHFATAAHAFEDCISELRSRPRLAGDDFLIIAIHQSELQNDLTEIHDLADKLVSMRRSLGMVVTPSDDPNTGTDAANAFEATGTLVSADAGDEVLDGVISLASTLAARLGKEVTVAAPEFSTSMLPEEYHGLLRDVLIQLTRNSLVHGIETPAERAVQGKTRCAMIRVRPTTDTDVGYPYGFVYSDDGRGLDTARIRRRAVERGILSEHEAAAMSDGEAATLIFEAGFSTAEAVTGDAGRGVGLDLVKSRIIDELGGEIFIDSVPGSFCEFTVLLPDPVLNTGLNQSEPALAHA